MSKKFGINTKSAEARARQESIKQEKEKEKREKLEDELWKDDDKQILKKQQRKVFLFEFRFDLKSFSIWFQEEKEKKETEKLQRKQENLKFLEEEETSLTTRKSSKHLDRIPIKVTRAQIQQIDLSTNSLTKDDQNPQKNFNENRIELEENLNHLQVDRHSARNVDEAIRILKSDENHFLSFRFEWNRSIEFI